MNGFIASDVANLTEFSTKLPIPLKPLVTPLIPPLNIPPKIGICPAIFPRISPSLNNGPTNFLTLGTSPCRISSFNALAIVCCTFCITLSGNSVIIRNSRIACFGMNTKVACIAPLISSPIVSATSPNPICLNPCTNSFPMLKSLTALASPCENCSNPNRPVSHATNLPASLIGRLTRVNGMLRNDAIALSTLVKSNGSNSAFVNPTTA